jgi:hypothetical protein
LVGVLSAIAIVPSAPVMVPELAPGAAIELTQLRDAVFAAAASLPPRWVAVGVGPADALIGDGHVGTFGGYGVDVRIALSPEAGAEPTPLPLCALVAGWIRGQVNPDARAEVHVYAADLDAESAMAQGRQLRADIDEAPDPIGVLIVTDGANTLTPSAPGGYDPESAAVQSALDDALAAGDGAALAGLPQAVVGRAAYQVLAGIAEAPGSAKELYRGAPYGVGYFAGVWHP